MNLHSLPATEAAIRRYVEQLWLPYHRELESTVEDHALADDVDLVTAELAFRLDRLDDDAFETWIAVDRDDDTEPPDELADGSADEPGTTDDETTSDLAETPGEFVGFVTTEVVESPSVFDAPDRLLIGDLYVDESHRGTGLARALLDRAVTRAHEVGCAELALDVDVDNDRAIAFYEKIGFEPHRRRLTVPVDEC